MDSTNGNDSNNDVDDFLAATVSSDLALGIIQYLNVIESGRLACVSKRDFYLVHQYRRLRGPELVTTSSLPFLKEEPTFLCQKTDDALGRMIRDCNEKIQTKPNLVLDFSLPNSSYTMRQKLPSFSASSNGNAKIKTTPTVNLGAIAYGDIQINQPAGGPTAAGAESTQNQMEHDSCASLMAMSFPGATILPFSIKNTRGVPQDSDLYFLAARLKYHNSNAKGDGDDDQFWKAMILYAAVGSGEASDRITSRMQRFMPNAVIVGGVCDGGHVSMPRYTVDEIKSMSTTNLRYLWEDCYDYCFFYQLMETEEEEKMKEDKKGIVGDGRCFFEQSVYDMLNRIYEGNPLLGIDVEGIFGVFLGGNVPVRSVVSLGVHSVLHHKLNAKGGGGGDLPRTTSNLVVGSTTLSKAGDGNYLYGGYDREPVHVIRSVRDTSTGTTYTPKEWLRKMLTNSKGIYHNPGESAYIGIKRPGQDGFELSPLTNTVNIMDAFVIDTHGWEASNETLLNAEVDFFSLNGTACMEDMDRTMRKLKEQTTDCGEKLLGALMYTCSGRGPCAGSLIPESMSDAKRFAKVFPDVPCLGFYAGGEYGPVALAGNKNVFQIGRALQQGFTAVFAVFIMPIKEARISYNLDDSFENVQLFVKEMIPGEDDLSGENRQI